MRDEMLELGEGRATLTVNLPSPKFDIGSTQAAKKIRVLLFVQTIKYINTKENSR